MFMFMFVVWTYVELAIAIIYDSAYFACIDLYMIINQSLLPLAVVFISPKLNFIYFNYNHVALEDSAITCVIGLIHSNIYVSCITPE